MVNFARGASQFQPASAQSVTANLASITALDASQAAQDALISGKASQTAVDAISAKLAARETVVSATKSGDDWTVVYRNLDTTDERIETVSDPAGVSATLDTTPTDLSTAAVESQGIKAANDAQDARLDTLETATHDGAAQDAATAAVTAALAAEVASTDAEQTAQDAAISAETHANRATLDAITGHGGVAITGQTITLTKTDGTAEAATLPDQVDITASVAAGAVPAVAVADPGTVYVVAGDGAYLLNQAGTAMIQVSPLATVNTIPDHTVGPADAGYNDPGLTHPQGLDAHRLSRESLIPLPADNKPLPGRYHTITADATLDGVDVVAGGGESYYFDLAPNTNLTVPGVAVAINHTGPNNETIHLAPHPTNAGEFVVKNRNAAGSFIPSLTTAEKIALGTVPFNTLVGDITLGEFHKFGPSGDAFTVVPSTSHNPSIAVWSGSAGISGINFKITDDPDATSGLGAINVPDGTTKQLWIIGQQQKGGTLQNLTTAGTFTVRNDAGIISLVSIENDRRWVTGDVYLTTSYNAVANIEALPVTITDAQVKTIFQQTTGVWQNLDGTSGVDAAAEWTTDTEYVGPDNKQFSLTVPSTNVNGPYVTNDGQTLTPGLYNLKYAEDRSAADSVPAIADDEATVAEIRLMDVVGQVGAGSSAVELISRSGSHNPGNGSPFQHATQHGKQGSTTYAAGIYTIGVGGLYDIDASLTLANGTSAGNVSAQIFVNGVAEGPIALISNDGVANFPGSGAALISRTLAAGDTVEFRQLTTPGFNVNKTTSMRIATRGGPRGADGVNGADGAAGTPGVDGANGADGVDGTNGVSVDHISLTAGTSAPGTTDTYTTWGDAGETVNLGTFDVPIPTATPGTPTRSESGTRLVQNGVDGGGSVTFPEAFKAGTTPTVVILPLAPGDNVNATLQSVSETGFNAWIVRNESDVGQSSSIHWMAIGELA